MTCNQPAKLTADCVLYAPGVKPPEPVTCGEPAVQLHVVRVLGQYIALKRCKRHRK